MPAGFNFDSIKLFAVIFKFMKNIINKLEFFLEKIDAQRDELLFLFIKPYWPRKILPNHVTYARLVVGIFLSFLLFFFGIENKILIISLFFIGIITDFIDGPVARGTNKVTEFGAILDSFSDRILIIPIAVYALLDSYGWLLLALILAEVANAIASAYYNNSKEIYLESNIFGKTKMVLMSIVFAVILIVWPNTPPTFFIIMLWLTVPLSFLSALTKILELKVKNET